MEECKDIADNIKYRITYFATKEDTSVTLAEPLFSKLNCSIQSDICSG